MVSLFKNQFENCAHLRYGDFDFEMPSHDFEKVGFVSAPGFSLYISFAY
jgi:hypothetical protein